MKESQCPRQKCLGGNAFLRFKDCIALICFEFDNFKQCFHFELCTNLNGPSLLAPPIISFLYKPPETISYLTLSSLVKINWALGTALP